MFACSSPRALSSTRDRKSTRLNSSHANISFYTLSLHDALPILRRLGVVVAGTHVHVALNIVPLTTHDERHLRVGLEPDYAIDDVNPDLLERLRPGDVRLFVAPRFELDQRHDLLAAFGRPDQRSDDGTHRT